jgi:glucose-1-phosphate thymidylyltransferase
MDSLIDAGDFVKTIQNQQGIRISAPEEIAYRKGWIDKEQLLKSAQLYGKSSYGKYLKQVAKEVIGGQG